MALRHEGQLSRTPSSDNRFLCLRSLSSVRVNIGGVDVSFFVNLAPQPKEAQERWVSGRKGSSGGSGWLIYRKDES